MRRGSWALLLVVSACGGNGSAVTPTPAPTNNGFTLPGPWTLETSVSASCSGFPENARKRSYYVSIYQTGYDTILMNVRVNGALVTLMAPSYSGLRINDHLRLVDNADSGKLVIDGTFKGSVSSSRIAGLLDGTFSTDTVDCTASNHGIVFTR
jgi:hypothetical protein